MASTQAKRRIIRAQPSVLRWAREHAQWGVAEAADALGIPEQELATIEDGEEPLDASLFRAMQRLYRLSESALLLPAPPASAPVMPSFRAGAAQGQRSRETAEAIRAARELQLNLSDLAEDQPELFPLPAIEPATQDDDAYAGGERARGAVGPPVATQKRWAGEEAPEGALFGRWRREFQRRGVLVLVFSMPWEDCRGFSLTDSGLVPTIVVNSQDKPRARLFTMAHELGHLSLGKPGICDVRPASARIPVERWCNQFAAAFLMPEGEVRGEVHRLYPQLSSDDWTPRRVSRVASVFGVSQFAAAIRLGELNISDVIEREGDRFWRNDRRRVQLERPRPADERGHTPRPAARLRQIGAETLDTLLTARSGGALTSSETADLLDLRVDQLPDLARRVREERAAYSAD